jgi:PAS domain S-box-containing protein
VVAAVICLFLGGALQIALAALLFLVGAAAGFCLIRKAKESKAHAEALAETSERLQRTEAKYNSIFEKTVEGVFQTTPEGKFLSANRALARMYGYGSPQHLIDTLVDIGAQLYVEPEQREALILALQKDDVITNFEAEVVRADGRTIWIRENVHAVRDDAGKLLYLEGTVEDISDRWWSEQRRRLQYATARVIEKAANVAEARPMILQTICEILDWDMAAIWDVDAEAGVLCSVEVWHAPTT